MMKKEKIIASLTSFPGRITTICEVVESILNQTICPDKIILYLADEQFAGHILPENLVELMHKRPEFEVRWWPRDIKSYKKLVPALIEFPEDVIITFDDDILYPANIVEKLLHKHRKRPQAVCACRVRLIAVKSGKLRPYGKWRLASTKRVIMRGIYIRKFRALATTGGGTLFPPHALHPDATRDDIFMDLCPTTDDLWFWAMSVLNNVRTVRAGKLHIINVLEDTQTEQLANDNVSGKSLNDKNIARIIERYPDVGIKVLKAL